MDDSDAKTGLVRAEIQQIHPLDSEDAGGSGNLSSSSLGAVVVGDANPDGSFPFAAEVCRESEFGGSLHWYHGTIVPGGKSSIQALEPVMLSLFGDEDKLQILNNRKQLGLPG
jgi:hypothetical protein